jgi:hypothetical protein
MQAYLCCFSLPRTVVLKSHWSQSISVLHCFLLVSFQTFLLSAFVVTLVTTIPYSLMLGLLVSFQTFSVVL